MLSFHSPLLTLRGTQGGIFYLKKRLGVWIWNFAPVHKTYLATLWQEYRYFRNKPSYLSVLIILLKGFWHKIFFFWYVAEIKNNFNKFCQEIISAYVAHALRYSPWCWRMRDEVGIDKVPLLLLTLFNVEINILAIIKK